MSAHGQINAERNGGMISDPSDMDGMPQDMQYEAIGEGITGELPVPMSIADAPVEPGIIDLAPKVLVGGDLHPSFTSGELGGWLHERDIRERTAARRLDSKRHLGAQATTGTIRPREGSVEDTEGAEPGPRKDPRKYMADKGARATPEQIEVGMAFLAADRRFTKALRKRDGR